MIDHCYWYSYTFFSVRRNFPSWGKGRREESDCRPISRSARVTEHRRGMALLLEGRILAGERERGPRWLPRNMQNVVRYVLA